MTDINCIIIAGPGGARMDFVAGWLGLLPNFQPSKWKIDPSTGASSGYQRELKPLDLQPNIKIDEYLSKIGRQLNKDSNLFYAGSCHGNYLHKQLLGFEFVKVVYINCSQASLNDIKWEFCCKTFLGTDVADEVEQMDQTQILLKMRTGMRYVEPYKTYPLLPYNTIFINYDELFSINGSRVLVEKLNLQVDEYFHSVYNSFLTASVTKDNVYARGRWWRKSDYVAVGGKLPTTTIL